MSLARNKKIGLLWILGPIVLLIAILMAFGIAQFILNAYNAGENNTTAALIRVILGFLGIIAVILIPVGIVMGIIFFRKKELDENGPYDERSGKGDASVIPAELGKWSWGAAGLTWIWGVYHGVWISLLNFIPGLNLVWWVVMGLKGNEWAWRKNKWESVEQFKKKQKPWTTWGIIFFVISLIMTIIGAVFSSD
jgi:hypothetical protein